MALATRRRTAGAANRHRRRDPAMLGRKDYTREEYDHAMATVDQQLAAYERLIAVRHERADR